MGYNPRKLLPENQLTEQLAEIWRILHENRQDPLAGGGAVASVNGQTGAVVLSTTHITEGSSLYFTDERVDDRVAALLTEGAGIDLSYNDGTGTLSVTVDQSELSTTTLPEGSNLYYTDERAQDGIGTILVDTDRIDFTYSDATPSITADIKANSVSRTYLANNVTCKTPLSGTPQVGTAASQLANGVTTSIPFYAIIPDDYVSGDVSFKVFYRPSVGSNTLALRKFTYRFRSGSALATIDNSVNINVTPASTNSAVITATIGSANFTAGDVIRFDIQRLGGDASDSNTGVFEFDGGWLEYTGYA